MKTRGFTLIELLIVVAIIAILAAIAVPNFLEAQVRAKTSRAKSDLRTMLTALESYAVDNNKYPAPVDIAAIPNNLPLPNVHSCSQFMPGGVHTFNGSGQWGGLTSPIAYITSMLKDPFAQPTYEPQNAWLGYQNIRLWQNAAHGGEGIIITLGENGTTTLNVPSDAPSYIADYGDYIVRSIGPDKGYSAVNQPYDPTNGTVSWGDVYRTQKRAKNALSTGGE